jgi:hypothetical protein
MPETEEIGVDANAHAEQFKQSPRQLWKQLCAQKGVHRLADVQRELERADKWQRPSEPVLNAIEKVEGAAACLRQQEEHREPRVSAARLGEEFAVVLHNRLLPHRASMEMWLGPVDEDVLDPSTDTSEAAVPPWVRVYHLWGLLVCRPQFALLTEVARTLVEREHIRESLELYDPTPPSFAEVTHRHADLYGMAETLALLLLGGQQQWALIHAVEHMSPEPGVLSSEDLAAVRMLLREERLEIPRAE